MARGLDTAGLNSDNPSQTGISGKLSHKLLRKNVLQRKTL